LSSIKLATVIVTPLIPRVWKRYCDVHTQGENTLSYVR